jgi:two-component system CheB/CheR fusion protein
VDVRSAIDQATLERRTVTMKDVRWDAAPGDARWIDVIVTPLIDQNGDVLGTKVTFSDITRYRALQEELQHSRQELETAYEELQSTNEELETTNEELQSTIEELETTNEELQSTNEELETINEEIQSTNEELQTMNEELQSTNEELQTMNEELRTRSTELNDANAFLQSILGSIRAGVIVVGRNMQVQIWNKEAEDLWGLRADEVRGAHLLNLDIGLPLEDVKPTIRAALAGAREPASVVVTAMNRRGRSFPCRVTCTPLGDGNGTAAGAILMMEDDRDREREAGSSVT